MRGFRKAWRRLALPMLAVPWLLAPSQVGAWNIPTHVYAANLVLAEAFSTYCIERVTVTDQALKEKVKEELRRAYGDRARGKSELHYMGQDWVQMIYYPAEDRLVRLHEVMQVEVPPFGWLRVDEETVRALRFFPDLFRLGNIGPDLFPDLVTGQSLIHPGEGPIAGDWAAFLASDVDRLALQFWQQPQSIDESPLLRAFYAGWLCHMAGDLFGHSWVNDYAGGVWPTITDGMSSEESKNIIRHLVVEAYVSGRIPDAYKRGSRVDVTAHREWIRDYLWKNVTGNAGRIDRGDSENDRFGMHPMISGYKTGAPYHLSALFQIRNKLRSVTRNINWTALKAGIVAKLCFGIPPDPGELTLLYHRYWLDDVDAALKELVSSQLDTASRMAAGASFDAFFDEIEAWFMDYGLSALGLPDAVGRGLRLSSSMQESITKAILPEALREIWSDIKRYFLDLIFEEAFGITLTELENALRDPATQLRNPALFPAGTREKIDREMGRFGENVAMMTSGFVPFVNSLAMMKLQLVDPAEIERILPPEAYAPIALPPLSGGTFQPFIDRVRLFYERTPVHLRRYLVRHLNIWIPVTNPPEPFESFLSKLQARMDTGKIAVMVQHFPIYWRSVYSKPDLDDAAIMRFLAVEEDFRRGVQMQFMRSLDAGYDWNKPDFTGCLLWDSLAARDQVFHRIFQVKKDAPPAVAAGLAPVTSRLEPRRGGTLLRPAAGLKLSRAPTAVRAAGEAAQEETDEPASTGRPPGLETLPVVSLPDLGVVAQVRPAGKALALPEDVHVHPTVAAFAEAPPPQALELRFYIDAPRYARDGRIRDLVVPARIVKSRVMVPLDVIAREFGGTLEWDAKSGVALLQGGGREIAFKAGNRAALVDGKRVDVHPDTEVTPTVEKGVLLIPAKVLEDHLGCNVSLDSELQEVLVEGRPLGEAAAE